MGLKLYLFSQSIINLQRTNGFYLALNKHCCLIKVIEGGTPRGPSWRTLLYIYLCTELILLDTEPAVSPPSLEFHLPWCYC